MTEPEKNKTTTYEQKRIVGQDRILGYLESALLHDRVSSGYLFHGPNAVGKRTVARLFLQSVLCGQRNGQRACGTCLSCTMWEKGTHPDGVIVENSEGGSLGVAEIRKLQKLLSYRPTVSEYRVALVSNADLLTIEAANALLKTVEEPPQKTVIIFCTPSLRAIPPTLRSRCQIIGFQLVKQPLIYDLLREQTDDSELALDLSHLAVGRPGLALQFLSQTEIYEEFRERATSLIELLSSPIAKRLQLLRNILPDRKQPQQIRKEVAPIFDQLLWLLRDAALIRVHGEEFLVHRFCSESLRRLSDSMSEKQLLSAMRLIEEAQQLIRQNVNPTLVFENFLLSL